MPLITIEAAGVTPEQKLQLIQKMPAEASRIMDIPVEEFRVFIREYPAENIGVGNVPLTEIFKSRGKI